MTEHIDKNSRVSLPAQLSEILLQRIKSGYYVPGRKLDSVRTIADSFGLSNLTVQNAFKILKDMGAVYPVPGSGIFVNKKFIQEQPPINIAFVFPEKGISPNILKPEDWVIKSEIHLGLLKGAELYGAKINFVYISEKMSKTVLLNKMREIRQNDAAVFVGSQLQSIQKELVNELYVFNINDDILPIPEGVIRVCHDRVAAMKKVVDVAKKFNCQSAGVVSLIRVGPDGRDYLEVHRSWENSFIHECKNSGLKNPEYYNWEIFDIKNSVAILRDLLQKDCPQFLLCNDAYFVRDIYEVCYDLDLRIGRDIKIMAKASGLIFQGLIPSLTYLKPPAFETAVDIVNYACQLVRKTVDKNNFVWPKHQYQLICGKSTGEQFIELLSEKKTNI